MPTHMHKLREANQTRFRFLVIVLTWAGLMDSPATVLDLPRVAISGKILATKAISVQRLSFTVFFNPLWRAKALGLFQKSCMSSKSCNVAMNMLPHLILSFHSATEKTGDVSHNTGRYGGNWRSYLAIQLATLTCLWLTKRSGSQGCQTSSDFVSTLTDNDRQRQPALTEVRDRIHPQVVSWVDCSLEKSALHFEWISVTHQTHLHMYFDSHYNLKRKLF